MAKLGGILPMVGKLNGLSFFNSPYGNIVRTIGAVDKDKLAKDPKQAGKRDMNKEFKYATTAGKLMRRVVDSWSREAKVGTTHHRLAGELTNILKKDTVNKRGERKLMETNAALLRGFNWNEGNMVGTALRANYEVSIDVATGTASLSIDELVPDRDVVLGTGATHVEIILVLGALDVEKDKHLSVNARSGMIALSSGTAMEVNLSCTVATVAGNVLMAGIGVQGYQEVNGSMMAMREGCGFEVGDLKT